MTLVVTGGAGFIGSCFVRQVLREEPGTAIVVLDKGTYAANPLTLAELVANPRVTHAAIDIRDREAVRELFARVQPAAVVHFAAETHVDRSIDGPEDFIHTNVVGTFHLLEESRRIATPEFRFVHVSTDEVFGSLGATGAFSETTRYAPRSPYSASKAASDHLVQSYVHTYGFPAITTNCSNNYGPYQFPEKLIPLTIHNALEGKRLPVYGQGENVRDWIFVEDHCAAVREVLARGQIGEHYLIGARNERTNLEVVHAICDAVGASRELVELVPDRPGHDFRYAIDPSKLERELGWRATTTFEDGLRATIAWYRANRAWSDACGAGARDRRGLRT